MTNTFPTDFLRFVQSSATSGPQPKSHSETDHVEYRTPVPAMRQFVNEWLAAHGKLSLTEWTQALEALYTGDSMEERMAAGMLLSHHKQHRQGLALDQLAGWLKQLHGWKEVDSNCQTVFTPAEMFARWGEWEPFLRRLAASPDLNLQRASLVLLVDVVRSSPDPRGMALAVDLMQQVQGERDKRISKAISWVLREAVKRHRPVVEAYLAANQAALPGATLREVQTKLATGKKRV
jgi:3-methyladenine DNA glycosylase AlkD